MAGPARARAPSPVQPSQWLLPDPSTVDDFEEVVGFGADLEPETLVDAYRRGLFPWPHEGLPLPWFSPDPRALVPVGGAHVSRSLRRHLRRCGWTTSVDVAFDDVVEGCTEGRVTWITPEMRVAYGRLHRLGWAHSLEVWDDGDRLVGGIYGVQVGGCFTGESMFHRVADASKVALVDLVDRLDEAGGAFLDAQLPTEHLARMGAVRVPRPLFLTWLEQVRDDPVRLALDRRPVSRLAGAP